MDERRSVESVLERTEMSAKAYRGSSGWGGPILTIDSNGWVYEGTPVFPITGTPIMKIDGEHIYRGSSSWGAPIATVKGEYVYKGGGFLSAPIALATFVRIALDSCARVIAGTAASKQASTNTTAHFLSIFPPA